MFIEAIRGGMHVRDAAITAKVHNATPYDRAKNDPAFALAWKEATKIGVESLEEEAHRRAYHGTEKPVFHKGEICGHIREYSDTLLQFLLKAHKPDVYREKVDHEFAGAITVKIEADDDFYNNAERLAENTGNRLASPAPDAPPAPGSE